MWRELKEYLCLNTIEESGGRQTQDFRADDVEHGSQDGRNQHSDQQKFLRQEVTHQAQGCAFEVFGLLYRPAHRPPRASTTHRATWSLLSSILHHHAISSAISSVESCEETMSR